MQFARKLIVIIAVSGAVLPLTARECMSGVGFNIGAWGPCGGAGVGLDFSLFPPCMYCNQPPPFGGCGGCGCGMPTVVPQPTLAPQASYVPQIQIRREAYVENVPVTAYQPVTRTVYVPQQVTEMVPQTVYQPQMRYRDVAYQTIQQVVATPLPIAPYQPASYAQPVAPSCAAPTMPTLAPTAASAYSSPAIPTMPSITVSPYGTTNPVPQYQDVPSASSGAARPTSARRSSMFRPAPSAARVQQSRRF
jgi:hypothetical protein